MNLRNSLFVLAAAGGLAVLATHTSGCASADAAPDSGYIPPNDTTFTTSSGSTGGGSTTGGSSGSTSGSGSTGGSSGSTGGTTGSYVASLTVLSHNNALPAPVVVDDVGLFIPDGGGTLALPDAGTLAATDLVLQHVVVAESLVSNATTPACPILSGTFCDGFYAAGPSNSINTGAGTDAGPINSVVDFYTYLRNKQPCFNGPPADGTVYPVMAGLWQPESTYSLFAISPYDCANVSDGGVSYSGSGALPSTNDIHVLLQDYSEGHLTAVRGVVIAVSTATNASSQLRFTVVIQDPAGGPKSAIGVFKNYASTTVSTAPALGDYIEVVGQTSSFGGAPQINI